MYKIDIPIVLLLSLTAFLLTVQSEDRTAPMAKKVTSQAIEKVQLSYSPVANHLTLHEPVALNFTIKNNLAQTIKLDLGQARKGGFLFTVTKPDGTRIQLSRYSREGIGRVGELSLEPEQIYTQRIFLNELFQFTKPEFDFTEPGKYEVEVRLANPVQSQEGKVVAEDTGSHFALEIAPRDAEQLKRVAATLAQQITKASSYAEAAEAAYTLAYMKDSVAVPYLEKALASGRMVESIAINGLMRIGDDNAFEALNSISKSYTGETAQLARGALNFIEWKRQNPDLLIPK